MFNIAICDDDEMFRNELENICEIYAKQNGMKINCNQFQSGREVLNFIIGKNVINILFLDIEIPDVNGIDLKEKLQYDSCIEKIIFISSHIEKVRMAFGLKVVDFIDKPIRKDKIIYWIDKAYNENINNRLIEVPGYGQLFEKQIISIKMDGNYSTVYLETGEKTDLIRLSIGDWEKILSEDFIRVHKSFVVNMNHIIDFKYSEIMMDSKNKIPIGRSYADIFKRTYREHVLDKIKGHEQW